MHRLLVCFGNAEHGRLGLGVVTSSSITVPRIVMALANYDLESVAAGGAHTGVVTRGGLLFTFGLNNRGQLGHSADEPTASEPGNVLLAEPVTAVAAGDAHTLCLTESGRVYAFGCNAAGQLGVGRGSGGGRPAGPAPPPSSPPSDCSASPRLVEALAGSRVVAVAAGGTHSLAVTQEGHLFAWGAAGNGRLGLGRLAGTSESGSQLTAGGPGASHASGAKGREHDRGGVGEEGADADSWAQWLPRRVAGGDIRDARVARVFAGPAVSACTDQSGRVYTWGYGGLHQLGHGGPGQDEWEPRLVDVPSLRRTRHLSLGAGHALACREDERVHVWGSDPAGAGCLGFGPAGPLGPFAPPGGDGAAARLAGRLVPRPTLFRFWFTDVGAGLAHSAGVSSDGRLYTWGWGGSISSPGGPSPPRLPTAGQPPDAAGPYLDASGSALRPHDGDRDDGAGPGAGAELGAGGGAARGPASAVLRLGGGQLGVGSGLDLATPTLVTKLEILPGEVFRQDNGDPFNYQDSNLGWLFRRVACGHNHTAAIIQVARSWTHALKTQGREERIGHLPAA